MRVSIRPSGSDEMVYIIADVYLGDSKDKHPFAAKKKSSAVRTTKTVATLGSMSALMAEKNMSRDQVKEWAKEQARSMTIEEKDKREKNRITVTFNSNHRIERNRCRTFNCGYLFLQSLYYDLRLDNICRNISGRNLYEYDLDAILSDLIYARILDPGSKRSSVEYCRTLLEPPKYGLHDVYRALSVLAKEMDYIQAEVYKNSNFIKQRNQRILYYDCTDFYFEVEEGDRFKEYGKSKENRPNPIVQMGMFMDGDALPLGITVFEGNKNEQPSLKPFEQKIIRDFELSKFVVCTDGGLGSDDNRQFNDIEGRAFIVTQSLKKLKAEERKGAMDNRNWRRLSDRKEVDITDIKKDPAEYIKEVYYKEEVYGTKKVPGQLMLVTYSPKYALYQKSLRDKQVERAAKMIEDGKKKKERNNPNDPARFVRKTASTKDGEAAYETVYTLNQEKIDYEAQFDGYYAVCTDLVDDDPKDILKICENRWEIEESFRIMKTDFDSRPIYVTRRDRVTAHLLTCFLALLIYRLLEHKLEHRFTCPSIISTLRKMNLLRIPEAGYIPEYTRTEITDALHEAFGFYTDYEISTASSIRSLIKGTKTHTSVTKK